MFAEKKPTSGFFFTELVEFLDCLGHWKDRTTVVNKPLHSCQEDH